MIINKLCRVLMNEYKLKTPKFDIISDIFKDYYINHDKKELNNFCEILKSFNTHESYNKIPLVNNEKFSLNLILWNKYGTSPIHKHDSRCTFMLLNGEVYETTYYFNNHIAVPIRSNFMEEGSISSLESHIYHSVHNIDTDTSLSLHLYDK